MKYITMLIVSVMVSGCSSTKSYDDAKMYELATQFKDLAQTVDSTIKFGDVPVQNGEQALNLVLKEQPNKISPFIGYNIKVEMQGNNAVMLLCDHDIALIEDAGCNAEIDAVYWKQTKPNSCVITLESSQVCQY